MATVLTVGMGQMRVDPGEPASNLARAVALIEKSAGAGCGLVVLPECLDLGWTDPSARELACPVPGERSEVLARAARRAGIHVAAGLTERSATGIHNAAVLLRPDGSMALHHRKINELDLAEDLYQPGTCLSVADTEFGRAGVTICADNFPDSLVLAEALARMGAQIILSPCAWAVPGDHDNAAQPYGRLWLDAYVPFARRYGVGVIGVSNTGPIRGGPWKGRKCIGCSLAVGPDGEVLARGPYGDDAEALLVVDVELREPWRRSELAITRRTA